MITKKVNNNKLQKKAIKDTILSSILAIFAIVLVIWGVRQLASTTPFGIAKTARAANGRILCSWIATCVFAFLACIPLSVSVVRLMHVFSKKTLVIHTVFPETTNGNRIVVSASENDIENKYIIISEVRNGTAFCVNLSNLKFKVMTVDTTIPVDDIKRMRNVPRKLVYALNDKASSRISFEIPTTD